MSGGPVLIDVRTEREFGTLRLDGAVNLPLSRLEAEIRARVPDLDTPIALYCATGARSQAAGAVLRAMGYRRVQDAGGLYAAAGLLQVGLC